ncbi:MAG TPA: histidine phosphatase family protein [Acidimicrobiales bacterium]
MELLLIRHARPQRAEEGNGPADPGLSPLGHRQAEALADWLSSEAIDAIYVSPMRRALETAQPLTDRLGLGAVVDPVLAEYDAGASAYIPIEELKAAGDPRWNELPDDIPGFQRRVVDGIERLIGAHSSGTVAVVCHGGVINVYLSWVLRSAHEMFFLPHYTSVSRVLAAGSGQRSVDSLNETGHLRVADVPLVELSEG